MSRFVYLAVLSFALAGCMEDPPASGSGYVPASMMDRVYPHQVSWASDENDHSFVAVKVWVPETTEWRVEDRIDAGVEDVYVWWMPTVFIERHDGHRMTKGTGSTNSFPVCEDERPGPVSEACDPASFREDNSGARARTAHAGIHLFFSVMYGAGDARMLEVSIHSDDPVEIIEGGSGRSELLIIDDGADRHFVDARIEYHADAPIVGTFQGIRASFSQFTATHESGLSFTYEKGDHHGMGEWYEDGEPVMSRLFSGPAGDWIFTAKGDRARNGPSSPVVGLLNGPFFVNEDGSMDSVGPKT